VNKVEARGEMSQLQIYAIQGEKYKVFDGSFIHRNAWIKKKTVEKKHAAVVAGITEDQLKEEDANELMNRMTNLKKGFSGWMTHHVSTHWLENATRIGLKNHVTMKPVETFPDILNELESNPTMENFLNWYNICHKDMDGRHNVKHATEAAIMRELKLNYTACAKKETPTTGGCIGDLLLEVQGKMIENLNARSRMKQGLHLVRSKPILNTDTQTTDVLTKGVSRRNTGDFYVVRSDTERGSYEKTAFNVSVHRY
jgi:hypothetical protein